MLLDSLKQPSNILMKHADQFRISDFLCTKISRRFDQISPTKFHRYTCLSFKLEELPKSTLVFNVEETLLKSSSWFPFFMLVAFEGGGLVRALLLLVLYPLLCMVDEGWKLKIMVFVCFFGVKRSTFRLGRTVLPKFFLENVGNQVFEVVTRFGKTVRVSNLPRVMVEGFLKDYLRIEIVYGRKLKVFGGYYLGLMEDKDDVTKRVMNKVYGEENIIGLFAFGKHIKEHLFTICKDIYLVSKADKEKWQSLPRDKYPRPLIFHDGRLAFLPTPIACLIMLIWLPFGLVLCILRIAVVNVLPYHLSIPVLAFLGVSGIRSIHYSQENSSTDRCNKSKGIVYVCNHKTLLDPIYVSLACGVHLTALTYSISKTSEILSPVKTIPLTRNREKDAYIMHKLLKEGSIVVCPEGTTCREPYLLRFSPLFAEICDDIIPVALDVKVSMFYGTTASGMKALDPIYFLSNPNPYYFVNFLEKLPKSHTCRTGGQSKVNVAKYVQEKIAMVLGYKCTDLTRKDKYTLLAGNTGVLTS